MKPLFALLARLLRPQTEEDLPTAALLPAKLLALLMLVSGHAFTLQRSWLPVDLFTSLGLPSFGLASFTVAGPWFGWAIAFGCLLILVSPWPRVALGLTGFVQLVGCLANRLYLDDATLLIGLVWLLASLESRQPRLLPALYALVLTFACYARLSDPDWYSGRHLIAWFTDGQLAGWPQVTGAANSERDALSLPDYFLNNEQLLGDGRLATLFSWVTLAAFGLAAALALFLAAFPAKSRTAPSLWPRWLLLLLGLFLHGVPMVITNQTQQLLWPALLVLLLSVAPWPSGQTLVLFDGDCGMCQGIAQNLRRLDLAGQLHILPSYQGRTLLPGLSEQQTLQELVVGLPTAPLWRFGGYRACKAIVYLQPLFWMLLLVALFFCPRWAASALLLGATPLFDSLGSLAYRQVARNRHLFGGTCQLPTHS